MNRVFTIICVMYAFSGTAQISNTNIDYHLQLYRVNWWNTGHENGNVEVAWRIKGRTSSAYNSDCDDDNSGGVCVTYFDEDVHYPAEEFSHGADVAYGTRVYYKVFGWENDDTNSDRYCTHDFGDDLLHCGRGTPQPTNETLPGRFHNRATHSIGSQSDIIVKMFWTYAAGQWGESSALSFGELGANESKYHDNSSQGQTINSRFYGYKSTFSLAGAPTQLTADVVYSFSIADDPKRVRLQTTNVLFDNYLHLVHDDGNGNYTHVASQLGDHTVNDMVDMSEDLCPGDYLVVFEGLTSGGNFRLTLSTSDIETEPGSIQAAEQNLCQGVAYPAIGSLVDASSELYDNSTPDRYEWHFKIAGQAWNTGAYEEIETSSLTPIGNMGTQDVIFRRRAIFCDTPTDWAYDTVYYTPSTIAAGAIFYTPEDFVREGYVLEADVINVVSGTGDPSPTSYTWAYQLPNATQFEQVMLEGAPYTEEVLSPAALGPLEVGFTNIHRVATNNCGQQAISNEVIIEGRVANGSIAGKVTAPPLGAGAGAEGVSVCAVPLDSIYGTVTVCDTTDDQGNYLLNDLYYNKSGITRYEVTPSFLDHEIRISESSPDSTRTISLNSTTHNISTATDFVDLTVFTVSGNVYQTFQENGMPDVDYGKSKVVIYLEQGNSGVKVPMGTTDADGNYSIIIDNIGTWTITPELIEETSTNPHVHTFDPPFRTLDVTSDLEDIDFENTTTNDISGFVGAGCDNFMGTIGLRFFQDAEDGSFDRIFRTNPLTGTFDYNLPARDYNVQYVTESLDDIPLDDMGQPLYNAAAVESQLTGFSFQGSLTHRDTTFTLYYRDVPSLTIEGMPALPECTSGSFGFPVLEQGVIYEDFQIRAWEGRPENMCPLDTGYMDIVDDIGGRGTGQIPISNGTTPFVLFASEPNIDPASQHLLTDFFSVRDFRNQEAAEFTLSALVKGEKSQKTTHVTVSPEIPLVVLHDPPGDHSSSFFTEESVMQTTVNTYTRDADITNIWLKAKKGSEFSAEIPFTGISFPTKIWLEGSGSTTVEEVETLGSGTTLRFSEMNSLSTSDLENFIGDEGDVFYGAAFNYLYALTDIVDFDFEVCAVDTGTSFFINPDSIATTFIKTTRAIENDINELKRLKNIRPDSSMYFQAQIDIWEQTLENNRQYKDEKANSADEHTALTISSGVSNSYASSSTVDSTNSYEFLLEVDQTWAVNAGVEIAGNGISGGFFTKMLTTIGKDSSFAESTTTTTGYTLYDDDTDDEFFINVYEDERYGTPLFVTTSATSSCPYEAPEFLPVDQFAFSHHIDSEPIQTGLDPDVGASYRMVISNLGTETRTYTISNDEAYNGDGLEVRIQNNAAGNDANITLSSPFDINPMHPISTEVVIVVNKAASVNVLSYRNIKINADPECSTGSNSDETRQSLFISATFEGECSGMDIISPTDNRVVSQADDNILPITMDNYDVDQLDRAILQYRAQGQQVWNDSGSFDLLSGDLTQGSSGTMRNWDMSEVSDEGLLEIRIKVTCTLPGTNITNINYSNIVLLHVDRVAPQVFGAPEPIDDHYDISMNDDISVTFSEEICDQGVTQAQAIIVDMVHGDTIQATISCSGQKIILTEQGVALGFRAASIYRVILSNVSDLNGNIADEIRWVFAVGDFDPANVGCIEGLEVTNNNENQDAINVSNYEAISIIADGVIPGFGTTTFEAEMSVELMEGFEIKPGAVFEANITDCEEE